MHGAIKTGTNMNLHNAVILVYGLLNISKNHNILNLQ